MIRLLPKLIPLILRHLVAYLELAAQEAAELTHVVARQLLAAALTLVGAMVTVLLGCLWVVVLMWDTQWRAVTIASLFLLFGLLTIVCGARVTRGWRGGQKPFVRLRAELDSDQQLVQDSLEPARTAPELQTLNLQRSPGP